MNPSTIANLSSQVNAWNVLIYLILVGLLGFFVRLYFRAEAKTEGSLSASLAALAAAVADLTKEVHSNALLQAGHSKDIEEHRRELDGLWKGEMCRNPNCAARKNP